MSEALGARQLISLLSHSPASVNSPNVVAFMLFKVIGILNQKYDKNTHIKYQKLLSRVMLLSISTIFTISLIQLYQLSVY
jgi:hypothetical protein